MCSHRSGRGLLPCFSRLMRNPEHRPAQQLQLIWCPPLSRRGTPRTLRTCRRCPFGVFGLNCRSPAKGNDKDWDQWLRYAFLHSELLEVTGPTPEALLSHGK